MCNVLYARILCAMVNESLHFWLIYDLMFFIIFDVSHILLACSRLTLICRDGRQKVSRRRELYQSAIAETFCYSRVSGNYHNAKFSHISSFHLVTLGIRLFTLVAYFASIYDVANEAPSILLGTHSRVSRPHYSSCKYC